MDTIDTRYEESKQRMTMMYKDIKLRVCQFTHIKLVIAVLYLILSLLTSFPTRFFNVLFLVYNFSKTLETYGLLDEIRRTPRTDYQKKNDIVELETTHKLWVIYVFLTYMEYLITTYLSDLIGSYATQFVLMTMYYYVINNVNNFSNETILFLGRFYYTNLTIMNKYKMIITTMCLFVLNSVEEFKSLMKSIRMFNFLAILNYIKQNAEKIRERAMRDMNKKVSDDKFIKVTEYININEIDDTTQVLVDLKENETNTNDNTVNPTVTDAANSAVSDAANSAVSDAEDDAVNSAVSDAVKNAVTDAISNSVITTESDNEKVELETDVVDELDEDFKKNQ
uniref:Uncharacterized protein n=1 Tax=viral metagenome TaxID=1070528 RepID=A0A6C0EBU9_9ZZZZ